MRKHFLERIYFSLRLKDGRTGIGTKGVDRISWSVLFPDGSMDAIPASEVAEEYPIKLGLKKGA